MIVILVRSQLYSLLNLEPTYLSHMKSRRCWSIG